MNWVKKLLGRASKDVRPSSYAPVLDPPEVMQSRVEAKRRARLAEWQAITSAPGWQAPDKVNRRDVEAALRAAGFKGRRGGGEAVFQRSEGTRTLSVSLALKTIVETDLNAPMQRLSLTGGVADQAFHQAIAVIRGEGAADVSQGFLEMRAEGFFLTCEEVESVIADLSTQLMALDLDARLAEFRAFDPSRPGSAGLHHLAALALAGEVAQLDGYVTMRVGGGDAGFVPFITDDMIIRARDFAEEHFH